MPPVQQQGQYHFRVRGARGEGNVVKWFIHRIKTFEWNLGGFVHGLNEDGTLNNVCGNKALAKAEFFQNFSHTFISLEIKGPILVLG